MRARKRQHTQKGKGESQAWLQPVPRTQTWEAEIGGLIIPCQPELQGKTLSQNKLMSAAKLQQAKETNVKEEKQRRLGGDLPGSWSKKPCLRLPIPGGSEKEGHSPSVDQGACAM